MNLFASQGPKKWNINRMQHERLVYYATRVRKVYFASVAKKQY